MCRLYLFISLLSKSAYVSTICDYSYLWFLLIRLGENKESERAKLLDDYWQRKKEAGANKMRANQDLYGRVKDILWT